MQELGGELAIKVTKFFRTSDAEADGKLGEGVGWLAGTIIFQVVLDAITEGTWEAVDPVLKAIAKFINWPMEFMGEAFKLIGKLGGYLIDGVKSLGKMAAQATGGALKAVVEALGSAGRKMMAMAENPSLRASAVRASAWRRGRPRSSRSEAAALAERKAAALAEREAAELAEEGSRGLGSEGRRGCGREGAELPKARRRARPMTGPRKRPRSERAKGEGDAAREANERGRAVGEAIVIELRRGRPRAPPKPR